LIHSPPAKPETGARPQIARGKNSNPNYVRIVNSYANEKGVVHRKDALRLVEQGRAEWVAPGQLRLTEHPKNTAGRRSAEHPYNVIQNGFEWRGGPSGDARVMKATRGPKV
jgi:hypothetical protein